MKNTYKINSITDLSVQRQIKLCLSVHVAMKLHTDTKAYEKIERDPFPV